MYLGLETGPKAWQPRSLPGPSAVLVGVRIPPARSRSSGLSHVRVQIFPHSPPARGGGAAVREQPVPTCILPLKSSRQRSVEHLSRTSNRNAIVLRGKKVGLLLSSVPSSSVNDTLNYIGKETDFVFALIPADFPKNFEVDGYQTFQGRFSLVQNAEQWMRFRFQSVDIVLIAGLGSLHDDADALCAAAYCDATSVLYLDHNSKFRDVSAIVGPFRIDFHAQRPKFFI